MPSDEITNQPGRARSQGTTSQPASRPSIGLPGHDILSILEQRFGPKIKSKHAGQLEPACIDAHAGVAAEDLLKVCRFLKEDDRLAFDMLNCVSGVDYLEPDPKKAAKAGFEPHLEVVYHLSSFRHKHRFVVKVVLPRWKDGKPGALPEVPSVTALWGSADWHEREVYDLSGVYFTGHPNLTRILLAEDWEGHPLRKDYEYPLEYHGIRGR
jgi:NADH-quinone oxidoreductase subunit C